jgi:hypothetical protein
MAIRSEHGLEGATGVPDLGNDRPFGGLFSHGLK